MEHQANRSLRYNTVEQVRVKQTRDQDFDFDVYGAYLQTVIRPTDALKLVPGYRSRLPLAFIGLVEGVGHGGMGVSESTSFAAASLTS